MTQMPTLNEFLEVAKEYEVKRGVKWLNNGMTRVDYLQRRGEDPVIISADLQEGGRMTLTVLRNMCRRLDVPPNRFGLDPQIEEGVIGEDEQVQVEELE